MHGLTGGGWKRSVGHGHRSEAARRGNPGKSGCGTYRRATSPRQPPTLHGAFYRSALYPLLARINAYLMRWLRKKHKRLRARAKAHTAWAKAVTHRPGFFAQWRWVTWIPPVW
jgi:hypothetical protein